LKVQGKETSISWKIIKIMPEGELKE